MRWQGRFWYVFKLSVLKGLSDLSVSCILSAGPTEAGTYRSEVCRYAHGGNDRGVSQRTSEYEPLLQLGHIRWYVHMRFK